MWQAKLLFSVTSFLVWGGGDHGGVFGEVFRPGHELRDPRGTVPDIPFDFKSSYADMQVETVTEGCTYPMLMPLACSEIMNMRNKVKTPKQLGEANELAWKCIRGGILSQEKAGVPCDIKFNAQVAVPLVHCEKEDAWGYDLGLNPGDYGMGLAANGVWSDWPTDEMTKVATGGFIHSFPMPARANQEGPFEALAADEQPSQQLRCAEVMKRAKRFEAYHAPDLAAGKRAWKKTLHGVRALRSTVGYNVVYGTAFMKAPGLKLPPTTKFYLTLKLVREATKSIVTLPKESFDFPYKKIELQFIKTQGMCKEGVVSCQRALNGMKENSPVKGVTTPAQLFEYVKAVEDCYAKSAGPVTDWNQCVIEYRALVMIPMKDCGLGSLGFDFGLNLGDFGLKIADSRVYVNTPNDHVRGLNKGYVKTVALARRTANKFDYGPFEPNADQRCRIMIDNGEQGRTQVHKDIPPLEVDNVSYWAFGVVGATTNPKLWLNGTTEIFGNGISFPVKDTAFGMYLTREADGGRTVTPDSRKYKTKV